MINNSHTLALPPKQKSLKMMHYHINVGKFQVISEPLEPPEPPKPFELKREELVKMMVLDR